MTEEERRGIEFAGRVTIGRSSLALVAALSGFGGLGLGWLGGGPPSIDEETAYRLESCRASEHQCSKQIVRYENFASEALPVLEASERGRSIAAQASLPRHLRLKPMGDKE